MNKIIALSYKDFNRVVREGNIENPHNWAFISIQEPVETEHLDYVFHETAPRVLVAKFYDIDMPVRDVKSKEMIHPIDDEEVKRIVNFVEMNKHKHFLIHCTMGIHRSGAVATFIHEYLTERGKEYATTDQEFQAANPYIKPRKVILEKLRNYANLSTISNQEHEDNF
jgi:predicted protein tyrosine phosphatase